MNTTTDEYSTDEDQQLDAGIKPYVAALRAAGVETFESCEGGPDHPYPEPTIRFHGQRDAGWLALHAAQEHDLPVSAIRRIWTIIDGEPVGPYWEIVFSKPATDVAY